MTHDDQNGTAKILPLPGKQAKVAARNDLHAAAKFGRCVGELRNLRSELATVLVAGPKHGSFSGVVSEMASVCGELRDYLLIMRRMEG